MKKAKVVKMNIRTRCEVYEVAEKMLGELKPYVSKNLLAEIKERLMGFSPEMQVELADRVMDYYFTDTICPTECLSADNALVACCIRITGEKVSLWLSEMIQKVTGYNDPLQDFLAEMNGEIRHTNLISPADQAQFCFKKVEEIKNVLKAHDDFRKSQQDYNEDLVVVMDMVRGFVEPNYDDEELIDCARIIMRTAEKILKDWDKKNSMDDFGHMWQKFSKEAAKAVKENFWNPWHGNMIDFDLSKEYLKAWLERKYWNK